MEAVQAVVLWEHMRIHLLEYVIAVILNVQVAREVAHFVRPVCNPICFSNQLVSLRVPLAYIFRTISPARLAHLLVYFAPMLQVAYPVC